MIVSFLESANSCHVTEWPPSGGSWAPRKRAEQDKDLSDSSPSKKKKNPAPEMLSHVYITSCFSSQIIKSCQSSTLENRLPLGLFRAPRDEWCHCLCLFPLTPKAAESMVSSLARKKKKLPGGET